MIAKPSSLFDREAEWADLTRLVAGAGPRLRLGIVYGRRRYGKSYLLRRLQESVGGLYHLALSEERRSALDRFAAGVGAVRSIAAPLRFDDWRAALLHSVDEIGRRGAGPQVLVLDEYPYLAQTSMDMDSAVQALADEAAAGDLGGAWTAPMTMILCGSAMSTMTGILSGTSPLRGRAALDMPLAPFDFRQSRRYWGMDDPAAAFELDAVLGGAAGYRDLCAFAGTPARVEDLAPWLASTVLNPSHALFREDEYLLREDPRVTVEAPYYSLLQAIAAGAVSQGRIAAAVGRKPAEIVHHLNVMTTAGFVIREEDLLTPRRPVYRIADPVVRFHHLITRRHRAMLEDRRAEEVWAGASATFRSAILGPHFESLCRRWVDRYASAETLGTAVTPARRVQLNDRSRRESFELDVAAARLPSDGATTTRQPAVQVLGEAKVTRLGVADLARLDRTAELLERHQRATLAPQARRLLFSADGFSGELTELARRRDDTELIDLDRLYDGS